MLLVSGAHELQSFGIERCFFDFRMFVCDSMISMAWRARRIFGGASFIGLEFGGVLSHFFPGPFLRLGTVLFNATGRH